MRHIEIFKDEISHATVVNLINNIKREPKVDLFFSTSGGMVSSMTILIHALHQHPDIKIYFFEEVNSCVIKLFLEYDGPMFLNQDLEIISFHAYDRELYGIRHESTVKILRELDKKDSYIIAQRLVDTFGITKKDKKKFIAGEFITYYPDSFKLFTKRKNIKFA